MFVDSLVLTEGTFITNVAVQSGLELPKAPTLGALFFFEETKELLVYTGEEQGWVEAGAVGFAKHVSSAKLHLTEEQHQKLQDLSASAADLNFVVGITAPVQEQLNDLVQVDNVQNTRLLDIEFRAIPDLQNSFSEHCDSLSLHLSPTQKFCLEQILSQDIDAADFAKLHGLRDLSSTLIQFLNSLGSAKGVLSMNGHRIINVGTPVAATDVATVQYVNTALLGSLQWKKEAVVAAFENIELKGLQTIRGVQLKASDRVLVKEQKNAAMNGIWLAASGDWSRATDSNSIEKLVSAAVFVKSEKSLYLQTGTVSAMNVSPIQFVEFMSSKEEELQRQIDELRAILTKLASSQP